MTAQDIWTALAFMAVVEGVLYALFPNAIRRMMMTALTVQIDSLRLGGLAIAALGVLSLWFLWG